MRLIVAALAFVCVSADNNTSNSTTESYTFDESDFFSTQNKSITFFSHADWGKGGWDGTQSRRARTLNEDKDEERDKHDKHEEGERKKDMFYQGLTAKTMMQVAAMSTPSFILALGDNFYDDGVASTNDSMWNSHFRDVYFRSDEIRGVPWHSAFGNHDLGYGDEGVQAQIDRTTTTTSDDDGVWSTPARWYSVRYDIPGGGSVAVIVVDTTWLAPSENDATNEEGGISLETQAYRINQQLKGLMEIFESIAKEPPTWLLVAGHYPLYSHGEKGDNEELKDYLRPLLESYNAHAYLCGHDHIAEHIKYREVDYIVTGHSTMNGDVQGQGSNSTLVWAGESTSGFTRWTATAHALIVEFIEANTSQVLYSHTFTDPLGDQMPRYGDGDDGSVYLPPFMQKDWVVKYFKSIADIYGLNSGETFFVGSAFAFLCSFGLASLLTTLTRVFIPKKKGRSVSDRLGASLRSTASEELDVHYRQPRKDTLYFETLKSQSSAAVLISPKLSLFQQIHRLATGKSYDQPSHQYHHQQRQRQQHSDYYQWQGLGYESVSLAGTGSSSDFMSSFDMNRDYHTHYNPLYPTPMELLRGHSLNEGPYSPDSDTSSHWGSTNTSFGSNITHSVHLSVPSLRTAPVQPRAEESLSDLPRTRPRRHSVS